MSEGLFVTDQEQEIIDALDIVDKIKLNIVNVIERIEETIQRLNISTNPMIWPSTLDLPEDLDNIEFIIIDKERNNLEVTLLTHDSTRGQYTIPIDLYLEFDNNLMIVNDEEIENFYSTEKEDEFTLNNVFD